MQRTLNIQGLLPKSRATVGLPDVDQPFVRALIERSIAVGLWWPYFRLTYSVIISPLPAQDLSLQDFGAGILWQEFLLTGG
jgi:hypothetical protein